MEEYWIWCGSVIRGKDGTYHMFASAWPKEMGFGAQWLFNSQIVHAVSETPEGPYRFKERILERRDRKYFDALNQHNPYILEWNGKYYLYYIGTTYGGKIPEKASEIGDQRFIEVWNKKRIGVAVSDSLDGPWERKESPILEPRGCDHWDCTITSNPAVAILEDGTTYMLYKSRSGVEEPMQIGVAKASTPEGPFERISENPILKFPDSRYQVEDPFLWYQNGKFHLLLKNDFKEDWEHITEEWGAGLYAESEDCIHWQLAEDPITYTRKVEWDNGKTTVQANLERPFLLRDEKGCPEYLFLATGDGSRPYGLEHSWNMVIPIRNDK